MRAVLALAAVLQATQAFAQAAPAAPAVSASPTATVPSAASAPAPAPAPASAPASASAPAPVPVPVPVPVPAAAPAIQPPVAPTPEVVEKLAQGDRAFAAGDHRAALFAYQDAVFLQPRYAFARVKLGRAYLALRYPAQAIAQAELALAADPGSEDARRLSEDARASAAGAAPVPATAPAAAVAPAVAPPAAPSVAMPATAAATVAGAIPPGATVVVVMPAGTLGTAVIPAPPSAPAAPPQPRTYRLSPGALEAPAPAHAPAGTSAAQRYRTALELVARRDYAGAISLLDEAIAIDPRLAVAYSARASAQFGLARFRDAADDYKAALGLDPALATPLYGLAECYRLLGDPLAAELYRRYAASRAPDVREDLRAIARERGQDVSPR